MQDHHRPFKFILDSLRGRFFYLFTALFLFLVLHPHFEGSELGAFFFILSFMAIPAAGMYAVSYEKRFLSVGIVLGVPTLAWSLDLFFGIELVPRFVGDLIALTFYLYTTLVVLTYILKAKKVTSDILYGAVCVYLMFGMTWMVAYRFLEGQHPGSILAGGGELPGGLYQISDLLYFSFVTLTTLGYGDMLPLTSQARSLAILEAACGVLYLAILIARLVSLYTTQPSGED